MIHRKKSKSKPFLIVNTDKQRIATSTHIGTRKYQQDTAAIPSAMLFNSTDKNIFALSDGMGGLEGGEKASKISAETLLEDFYSNTDELSPTDFFRKEIDKTDKLVVELRDENGTPIEAGATLVAIITEGDRLYWASVGDSRIYLIRGDEITVFNTEHNYYNTHLIKAVENKTITIEEADSDKTKEALTSYIGINGVSLIDMNSEPFILEDNDVVLLCSDGLFKSLDDATIKNIVAENIGNIPSAAKKLTQRAVENRPKGQDNTTVILVKYNNTL